MKIEILQEQLLKGLEVVTRAVSTRAQLPVLSHLLIEAGDSGVVLSATDLELGIRMKIAAKVVEEGKVAVPAKMFGEFLASLAPGKIELLTDKETLIVTSPNYKGKFQTIDAAEFPAILELDKEMETCQVEQGALRAAIERVVFASAKDTLRPVLTGILWETHKNKIRVVATDGFRLSVEEVGASSVQAGASLLIPARGLTEVIRLEGDEKIKVGHLTKNNQVAFLIGDVQIVCQLLDGSFPDYAKILPKEFKAETLVLREELLKAVKAAHIFARDNSNMVRWQFKDSGLVLVSSSQERGECRIEVGASTTGEPEEIVFNAKYVIDYLSASTSERVWLGTGGKLSPGMLKDEERASGQYVVMPINA